MTGDSFHPALEKKRDSHDKDGGVMNESIDIKDGFIFPQGGLLAIDAQGRVSLFVIECYMDRFMRSPSLRSIKNTIHHEDLSREEEETCVSLRKPSPQERKWILRYLETSSRSYLYTPEGQGSSGGGDEEEEEVEGSLLRPLPLCGGGGCSSSSSFSHFLSKFHFHPSSLSPPHLSDLNERVATLGLVNRREEKSIDGEDGRQQHRYDHRDMHYIDSNERDEKEVENGGGETKSLENLHDPQLAIASSASSLPTNGLMVSTTSHDSEEMMRCQEDPSLTSQEGEYEKRQKILYEGRGDDESELQERKGFIRFFDSRRDNRSSSTAAQLQVLRQLGKLRPRSMQRSSHTKGMACGSDTTKERKSESDATLLGKQRDTKQTLASDIPTHLTYR